MVKLVVAKVAPKNGKRRRRAVSQRRVRDQNGEFMTQFWVDTNSPTFDDDLTSVFKGNVTRARQANTYMFGSPEGFRKTSEKAAEKFVQMVKSFGSSDGARKK